MNYYLYKLKPKTPMHFGDSESSRSLERSLMSFCADTLFSGLCHVAYNLDGEEGIDRLVSEVKGGNLLISDGMPFFDDTLYLPKPFIKHSHSGNMIYKYGKELKKLSYIPVEKLKKFIEFTEGKETIDLEDYKSTFGIETVVTRASIRGEEQSKPYTIGAYRFKEDAGLYIILGYSSEELLEYIKKLLSLLGMGGIGGKTTSGYGRYEMDDEIYLDEPFDEQTNSLKEMLSHEQCNAYISITTALPLEMEMETALKESSFGLVRRGGFVSSETFAQRPYKKKTQYFLKSGSVFRNIFEGDIYDVSIGGTHPCYRYAKPIFLGVKI